MPELLVVVTMDCEPPKGEGPPSVTGPRNWEEGAAYIESYCAIADRFGFPVSLFLHPEVATHQQALVAGLERGGAVSGLHLHPWKYDPAEAMTHLGHMAGPAQRRLLARAAAEWSDALGRPCDYFRPGTFSANDLTAPILAELGFTGVSLSVPGRIFPDLGAVWAGAPADPHLMHEGLRIYPGEMRLSNMPLTVDLSETRERGIRRWHPDLRPDQPYEDIPAAVGRIVGQIAARRPAVPVLNIVTHNDNDYTDPGNWVRRNYEALLAAFRPAAEAAGYSCRGATIRDVCNRVLASPPAPPAFVMT